LQQNIGQLNKSYAAILFEYIKTTVFDDGHVLKAIPFFRFITEAFLRLEIPL